MKLKTNLSFLFITGLVVAIVLSLISVNFIFNHSFRKFVKEEQDAEFQEIASNISTIIQYQNGQISSEQLDLYSRQREVHISIYDRKGNLLTEFNGIPDKTKAKDYITKTYSIRNNRNENIGSLVLEYDESNLLITKSMISFRENLQRYYLLISVLVVGVGFLFTSFVSRKISRPIEELSEMTDMIRSGMYPDNFPQSGTYEIQTLSNNIHYLSETLQMQERHRKDYAQDISHELRTPLTNLQLHLEAIQDGILEMDDKAISVLLAEVQRLSQLVTNLKETFNESKPKETLHIEYFDVSQEVQNICDRMEPNILTHGIELVREIDPDICFSIDKQALNQVLYNLLSNAIKATDEGGFIVVRLKQNAGKNILTVKDSGVGIAPEDQIHIFDRFYRVDSARNTKRGGFGLGLAITKSLVESMGGDVALASLPGRGSEFFLTFPMEEKKELPQKKIGKKR